MSKHDGQRPADSAGDGEHPLAGRGEAHARRDGGASSFRAEPLLVRRKIFRTWIGTDGREHGRWTWDYV